MTARRVVILTVATWASARSAATPVAARLCNGGISFGAVISSISTI